MEHIPDRRSEDWYKKALVAILEAHFSEFRRARRWRFAFRLLSSLTVLLVLGMVLFAAGERGLALSGPHVASIDIRGPISANAEASAERIIQGLRKAFENRNAQAVLLKINSPGGSASQAEAVYTEILKLKRKHPKPVFAAIDDVGASAAYYIAVAADTIYASRSSIVGSIGVRIDSFNFSGLMDRLGIERKLYTSGKFKGVLDMFSKPDPVAEGRVLETLKVVHQQFIEAVKQNRGGKLKDDPMLFTGMFWSGEEALQLGLVDGLLTPSQFDFMGLKDVSYNPPVVDMHRVIGMFETLAGIVSAIVQGLNS